MRQAPPGPLSLLGFRPSGPRRARGPGVGALPVPAFMALSSLLGAGPRGHGLPASRNYFPASGPLGPPSLLGFWPSGPRPARGPGVGARPVPASGPGALDLSRPLGAMAGSRPLTASLRCQAFGLRPLWRQALRGRGRRATTVARPPARAFGASALPSTRASKGPVFWGGPPSRWALPLARRPSGPPAATSPGRIPSILKRHFAFMQSPFGKTVGAFSGAPVPCPRPGARSPPRAPAAAKSVFAARGPPPPRGR